MTSLKTSIKTITYLSDIGCLEIQGASLINRFIVRPVTPDELAERLHEKQELPPVRLKTQSYSLRLE